MLRSKKDLRAFVKTGELGAFPQCSYVTQNKNKARFKVISAPVFGKKYLLAEGVVSANGSIEIAKDYRDNLSTDIWNILMRQRTDFDLKPHNAQLEYIFSVICPKISWIHSFSTDNVETTLPLPVDATLTIGTFQDKTKTIAFIITANQSESEAVTEILSIEELENTIVFYWSPHLRTKETAILLMRAVYEHRSK
jgi:hypothetical protein